MFFYSFLCKVGLERGIRVWGVLGWVVFLDFYFGVVMFLVVNKWFSFSGR